ncbi:MAG: PilZ domain-containing protein [Spirochaetales bacterium]|nr:PilZ domain-containing protein [Spirochaetales bacterium]
MDKSPKNNQPDYKPDLERRAGIRIDISDHPILMAISTEDDNIEINVEIINLSETGMAIQTKQILPVRKKVRFTISLSNKKSVLGIGRVMYGFHSFNHYHYGINIQEFAFPSDIEYLSQIIHTQFMEKNPMDR